VTARSGTRSPPEGTARVAVIGAGAVGLTLAGRLAQHGISVEVFEAAAERERIGSRAICMQRETLEIWERLGIGQRVADRGVRWTTGRTYHRGRELFSVVLPDSGEHFPPFVNISQSEVEDLLEERLDELGVPIHRGHRLTGLAQDAGGVDVTFDTAGGERTRRHAWVVGADGAHSGVRHALGVAFDGYTFDDRFLIADVRARLPFSNERHFHFDPPWNPGRQVLIHPQPDGVWRIDWQVPPETDVDAERASGRLDRRIRQVIGDSTPFELVWVTSYRFSQRVADGFRHGRVFLAGDAAHVMSPFGARGLNSGVADAENLAWRLAWVIRDRGSVRLLDGYDVERRGAAVENLAATEATMRFMAPHGAARRAWRNLVLRLAPRSTWFRRQVNSGRLAEPARYRLRGGGGEGLRPGTVAPDVRMAAGRLRDWLGREFAIVTPRDVATADVSVVVVGSGTPYGDRRAWLVRPDGYLVATAPAAEASVLSGLAEAAYDGLQGDEEQGNADEDGAEEDHDRG
jgi:2-polyprenyl-6-methoxyphenol hydroxylase-like FAD-dependent oxidoreductase